jgi:hypothetical protein
LPEAAFGNVQADGGLDGMILLMQNMTPGQKVLAVVLILAIVGILFVSRVLLHQPCLPADRQRLFC